MSEKTKLYSFWVIMFLGLLTALLSPSHHSIDAGDNSIIDSYQTFDMPEEESDSLPSRLVNRFSEIVEFVPANLISRLSEKSLTELRCLALNNYYEAATEGKKGMIAVSQVTLNRVNTEGFPGSVCGVVHHKTGSMCQFSWVCQRKLPKLEYDSDEWRDAVVAASKVYYGEASISPLKGALFYHATYVKPNWKKYKKIIQIGRHIFYGVV